MSRIGSVGYILVHNVFELSFTPKPYFPYYFLLEKFKNYYICQVMRNSRTYLFAFPYPVNFIGWEDISLMINQLQNIRQPRYRGCRFVVETLDNQR